VDVRGAGPLSAPGPIVAVLAGGRGLRIGGAKPTRPLAGRPLISYPLSSARAAGLEAVVVAKPDTALPQLQERVIGEPDEPPATPQSQPESGGEVIAHSNLQATLARHGVFETVFKGRREDRLRRSNGGWKIAERRVDLVLSCLPRTLPIFL